MYIFVCFYYLEIFLQGGQQWWAYGLFWQPALVRYYHRYYMYVY